MTVETPAKIPESALKACDVLPDDGAIEGYIAALEAALTRCKTEIEARV